jgi:hypothetical protein
MSDSAPGPGGAVRIWAGHHPSGALTLILIGAWLFQLHWLAGWVLLAWLVGHAVNGVRWRLAAVRVRRDEWRLRRGRA